MRDVIGWFFVGLMAASWLAWMAWDIRRHIRWHREYTAHESIRAIHAEYAKSGLDYQRGRL